MHERTLDLKMLFKEVRGRRVEGDERRGEEGRSEVKMHT